MKKKDAVMVWNNGGHETVLECFAASLLSLEAVTGKIHREAATMSHIEELKARIELLEQRRAQNQDEDGEAVLQPKEPRTCDECGMPHVFPECPWSEESDSCKEAWSNRSWTLRRESRAWNEQLGYFVSALRGTDGLLSLISDDPATVYLLGRVHKLTSKCAALEKKIADLTTPPTVDP